MKTSNPVVEKIGTGLTLMSARLIINEKEFHRQQSLSYFRAFNDLVLEDPEKGAQNYSPLQVFFQEGAQHHAQQAIYADVALINLQTAVDTTTFI